MSKPMRSAKIGDLEAGRVARLKAAQSMPMSMRLAKLYELCRQMSAIKGSATGH